MTTLSELIAFANDLADAGRPIAMGYFRRPIAVENKADDSPVTVADREIESVLRAMIRQRFPEHGILGEEHGSQGLERPYTWVLDPIDGTKSFITGMPLFGTLIALLEEGTPVLGVVDMPALGERWVGARGCATTWNGSECRTSGCTELNTAVLYTVSIDIFTGDDWRRFDALSNTVRFRRFGGDCYSYGLLAAGLVDLVVEADLQPYDYLAMVPVIEGAGGRISDWNGASLDLHSDGRVAAAATPALHARALGLLA